MTKEEYQKIRDEKVTKIERLEKWQWAVFAIGVSLLIISFFILFKDDGDTLGWLLFSIGGVPMLGVECILHDAIKELISEWQAAFDDLKYTEMFGRL